MRAAGVKQRRTGRERLFTPPGRAMSAAGCDVTWIDLPARGIHGNSHALMADDNSDDIAGLVLDWMTARGILRG